jgi:hypothetical protein
LVFLQNYTYLEYQNTDGVITSESGNLVGGDLRAALPRPDRLAEGPLDSFSSCGLSCVCSDAPMVISVRCDIKEELRETSRVSIFCCFYSLDSRQSESEPDVIVFMDLQLA